MCICEFARECDDWDCLGLTTGLTSLSSGEEIIARNFQVIKVSEVMTASADVMMKRK